MPRCTVFLRNGLATLILAIGLPVAVPAVEPNAGSPPRVSYAPTDRIWDRSGCRAKMEKELPSAAVNEEYHHCKIDFARLEHAYPLTQDDLKKITRENIKAADQEQLDQIYARLTAGPIPDGPFEIDLFRPRDFGHIVDIAQKLADEKLKGLALLLSMPEDKRHEFVRQVWYSKKFEKNQRIVRTQIDNWSKLLALMPQQREKDIATKDTHRSTDQKNPPSFPAKVYCGQSLLDGRRESIIMDYTFNDDIHDYHPDFDWMLGRHGLRVRDEIRMVRPGFYLGRTYMGRIFVLNFILYNKAIAEQDTATAVEDCWIGSQRVTAASK